MTQLYQSKIFAKSSTTMPKPMRDALGVRAGDSVRCVISEDVVLVSTKFPSEKAQADYPALSETLDAAEPVIADNRTLLRDLN